MPLTVDARCVRLNAKAENLSALAKRAFLAVAGSSRDRIILHPPT